MKYDIKEGQRFGRLTIIKEVEHLRQPNGGYRRMFLCKCDCGNEKVVRLSSLMNGDTSSCGCYKKEVASNAERCHHESKTRLYNCWQRIKNRCYRESNHNYKFYGARGIKVCDEWKDDYFKFKDWAITNGYQENLTIDRIDPNGNYEPSNCRWITQKEQTRNMRSNTIVDIKGVKFTLSELCEVLQIFYPTAVKRINKAIKNKQL